MKITPIEAFKRIRVGHCKGKYDEYCKIVQEALEREEEENIIVNEFDGMFRFATLPPKTKTNEDGSVDIIPQVIYSIEKTLKELQIAIIRRHITKICYPKELSMLDNIMEHIKYITIDEPTNGDHDCALLIIKLNGQEIALTTFDKEEIKQIKELKEGYVREAKVWVTR